MTDSYECFNVIPSMGADFTVDLGKGVLSRMDECDDLLGLCEGVVTGVSRRVSGRTDLSVKR